jgi:hypothetical protein
LQGNGSHEPEKTDVDEQLIFSEAMHRLQKRSTKDLCRHEALSEMDLVLCWLLEPSVLEKRDTTKRPGSLMTHWLFMSACHAGRLGDHPTPVGSGRLFMHLSSNIGMPALSHRSLLPTLASLSPRSPTLSSAMYC